MRPELQGYLDGELRFEDLPSELREQARGWDQVVADLDGPAPAHSAAPAWIENAVMEEIEEGRGASSPSGIVGWLVRPRNIRVSPLFGGLAAAAIGAVMLLPRGASDDLPVQTAATIYVQFVMEAPSARSVAVAGDFDEWEGEHQLVDTDGDGVWTGRIAVQPGIHEYMFVVDGQDWVTPPGAEGYRDDGFGNQNAVVTVLPAV